eukprot:3089693-Amphidinium_carterae.6
MQQTLPRSHVSHTLTLSRTGTQLDVYITSTSTSTRTATPRDQLVTTLYSPTPSYFTTSTRARLIMCIVTIVLSTSRLSTSTTSLTTTNASR